MSVTLCMIIIAAVIWALLRRVDVRLVLLTASVALFALAGKLPELLVKMSEELANPRTVVPICSAMGFAYVLRVTECDKHLVHLLLRPLDRPFARALLIPGCVTAGFVVNMAVVSQSGAAAVVGAILLPLLLSKGISRATAGSLLLLGCSMGGQLFNPGAVEIVTLNSETHVSCGALAQRFIPLNLIACVTALLVYWYLAARRERARSLSMLSLVSINGNCDVETPLPNPAQPFRINSARAAVPFVPLLALMGSICRPLLNPLHRFPEHVTILAAMLIGVVAAGLTSPSQTGKLARAFFDGMGFAYGQIISITVSATLFAEGIKVNGLIQSMVGRLSARPGPALLASLLLPGGLAALSGSGAGAASSMIHALIPGAAAMHLDPAQTGALIAIAAQLGRTMSPVAAVTILCATLAIATRAPHDAETDAAESEIETKIEVSDRNVAAMALTLAKRVAPPLLAGGAVMYLAALAGVGR